MMLLCGSLFATLHNVDVGGGPGGPTPYYAPQFLTIEVGDTVLWTWSSGTHNVTSTSGPASFASANLQSPATFQHVFTIAGVYDYECTLFNHSNTQFGTITVVEPVAVDPGLATDFEAWPNPFTESLNIKAPEMNGPVTAELYEATSGRLIGTYQFDQNEFQLPAAALPAGRYLLQLQNDEMRKVKVLQKF